MSSKRFNVGAYVKARRAILKDLAEEKANTSAAVKTEQQKIRRLKEKVILYEIRLIFVREYSHTSQRYSPNEIPTLLFLYNSTIFLVI